MVHSFEPTDCLATNWLDARNYTQANENARVRNGISDIVWSCAREVFPPWASAADKRFTATEVSVIVEVALSIVAAYLVVQAIRFFFHIILIVWATMADSIGGFFASAVVLLAGIVVVALLGLAVLFVFGN